MQTEEMRLDGNAAGGRLRDVFALDATAARATCAGCNATAPLGALAEYGHDMGVVLRCSACGTAVLRIVQTPERLHVDFAGMTTLTFPLA
jgi:NAD-dependent SIR2 family protein deacetylase